MNPHVCDFYEKKLLSILKIRVESEISLLYKAENKRDTYSSSMSDVYSFHKRHR